MRKLVLDILIDARRRAADEIDNALAPHLDAGPPAGVIGALLAHAAAVRGAGLGEAWLWRDATFCSLVQEFVLGYPSPGQRAAAWAEILNVRAEPVQED